MGHVQTNLVTEARSVISSDWSGRTLLNSLSIQCVFVTKQPAEGVIPTTPIETGHFEHHLMINEVTLGLSYPRPPHFCAGARGFVWIRA